MSYFVKRHGEVVGPHAESLAHLEGALAPGALDSELPVLFDLPVFEGDPAKPEDARHVGFIVRGADWHQGGKHPVRFRAAHER
jgi:hypothetical protein